MELKLRGLRTPLFVFCLLYIAITIVLPTVTIFLVGGLKTYGVPITWENLSLDNYKYVLFEWDQTQQAIKNSIGLGLAAATITMALPSFTTGSNVFNDDVAGITASYQFNETVGVTALWARPYNDNYVNTADHNGNRSSYMSSSKLALVMVQKRLPTTIRSISWFTVLPRARSLVATSARPLVTYTSTS